MITRIEIDGFKTFRDFKLELATDFSEPDESADLGEARNRLTRNGHQAPAGRFVNLMNRLPNS